MAGLRVSTKGRYGLRFMLELAKRYGEGPVLVDVIAKSQELSAAYLHVLANGLRAAGLLLATRGPTGGYALARSPAEISAAEVVTALEGKLAPVDCVQSPGKCKRAHDCVTRDLWAEVGRAANDVLERVTLAELARRQQDRREVAATYDI